MRALVASVICVLLALSFPGIDSKLEDKFTKCGELFFKEKPPVIPGILERSEPQTNGFRVICQKYKNKIRYATLYNTTGRIPVFSAYKYTRTTNFTRPKIPRTWMIELQLEPSSTDMKRPFVYQARNQDYWKNDKYNCSPGTLFPMSHAADRDTAISTLTLTNSVPQKSGRIWNRVENRTREKMDTYCWDNRTERTVAYVLTGVIPGNEMLNKRVNIPLDMWTAFCCYNTRARSWVSKTYNAKKYNNSVNITLMSLEDLLIILRQKWGRKLELFNNNCQ